MPRRKKKSQAYVWGDTPEIQALGAGFARQGYFMDGYDEARLFANKTTAYGLSTRPDEKARYAYTVGVEQKPGRGEFILGLSAKDTAQRLGYTSDRALRTAFEAASKLPSNSCMPGFTRANLNGQFVFKPLKIQAVANQAAIVY